MSTIIQFPESNLINFEASRVIPKNEYYPLPLWIFEHLLENVMKKHPEIQITAVDIPLAPEMEHLEHEGCGKCVAWEATSLILSNEEIYQILIDSNVDTVLDVPPPGLFSDKVRIVLNSTWSYFPDLRV